MADKPNDFMDQYQALVREGLAAWSRQFDPAAAPAAEFPSADITARMFAGLGGYGDWMRSMASGEPLASAATGVPPFAAPAPGPLPFGPGGPGMPPFGHAAWGGGTGPFGYGAPPGASARPGTPAFDDWAAAAREALSMPAFGLTREQQEEQQALLRAWIDYAEHYQRYQALLQTVQERAGAALRAQAPSTDAESMRSVYDRWVALAEESYAEAALSEEFKQVYASLVNAQMRLKRLQQKQIERLAVQAGMPTRTEVDRLGERLQAMRREVRQLQGLKAELDALKAELAASRPAEPVGSAVKTAKRSSPSRSSTVTREASAAKVAKAANRAGPLKAVAKATPPRKRKR